MFGGGGGGETCAKTGAKPCAKNARVFCGPKSRLFSTLVRAFVAPVFAEVFEAVFVWVLWAGLRVAQDFVAALKYGESCHGCAGIYSMQICALCPILHHMGMAYWL